MVSSQCLRAHRDDLRELLFDIFVRLDNSTEKGKNDNNRFDIHTSAELQETEREVITSARPMLLDVGGKAD